MINILTSIKNCVIVFSKSKNSFFAFRRTCVEKKKMKVKIQNQGYFFAKNLTIPTLRYRSPPPLSPSC